MPPASTASTDALEAFRARLIDAAIQAYEDAGISGLCHEGRWECALDAMRRELPAERED